MNEILEERARELALRGSESRGGPKSAFLVSSWKEAAWAFPAHHFRSVVRAQVTPCPPGAVFRGVPCSAFLFFHSKIYPVVPWSRLVSLGQSEEASYAVSPLLGLALELSADCRILNLDQNRIEPWDSPHCQGRLDGVWFANLETLF